MREKNTTIFTFSDNVTEKQSDGTGKARQVADKGKEARDKVTDGLENPALTNPEKL